jgi:hypothetical protein
MIRPPVVRTDSSRNVRVMFLCSAEAPFLRPGLISIRGCAETRSGMAEGHRVAAQSVLNGGKHNATLGQVGITKLVGSAPHGNGHAVLPFACLNVDKENECASPSRRKLVPSATKPDRLAGANKERERLNYRSSCCGLGDLQSSSA